MGKKRKTNERDDEPPEYATENEKKKSRNAAYSQLSTETLLIREKEVTQELVKLQNELNTMRSTIDIHYRSDALRQMNTKRYRAEYALGEIKAEIERRARRKMGQEIPSEGVQSGSASGVAAVTPANTSYTKIRETMAQSTSVLAETLAESKQREANERAQRAQAQRAGSSGSSKKPDTQLSGSGSSNQSLPFGNQPQMGVNFHGGSAMQAMAMMGAMGGPMGAAAPTAEEMASAANMFQQMQQAFMGGMGAMASQAGQASGQAKPAEGVPKAFGARPPSNVPAGIAKRFKQNQQ